MIIKMLLQTEALNLFVQQHDAGIQDSSRQTKQDSLQFAALRHTALKHTRQANHTNQCSQHAQTLLQGELLLQKHRRQQNHHNGSQIIAQCTHRHRGVAIGFKQQNPIKAQCTARKQQPQQIFLQPNGRKAFVPADSRINGLYGL